MQSKTLSGIKYKSLLMFSFILITMFQQQRYFEDEPFESPRFRGKNDTRLTGATVFPTQYARFGQHPAWICSLRTRGFRGRHRCGVSLLSGPTTESPGDPYVLVGTAHCNYICKDRDTGNVLETCCCRPPANPASCAQVRPAYHLSLAFQ